MPPAIAFTLPPLAFFTFPPPLYDEDNGCPVDLAYAAACCCPAGEYGKLLLPTFGIYFSSFVFSHTTTPLE